MHMYLTCGFSGNASLIIGASSFIPSSETSGLLVKGLFATSEDNDPLPDELSFTISAGLDLRELVLESLILDEESLLVLFESFPLAYDDNSLCKVVIIDDGLSVLLSVDCIEMVFIALRKLLVASCTLV